MPELSLSPHSTHANGTGKGEASKETHALGLACLDGRHDGVCLGHLLLCAHSRQVGKQRRRGGLAGRCEPRVEL